MTWWCKNLSSWKQSLLFSIAFCYPENLRKIFFAFRTDGSFFEFILVIDWWFIVLFMKLTNWSFSRLSCFSLWSIIVEVIDPPISNSGNRTIFNSKLWWDFFFWLFKLKGVIPVLLVGAKIVWAWFMGYGPQLKKNKKLTSFQTECIQRHVFCNKYQNLTKGHVGFFLEKLLGFRHCEPFFFCGKNIFSNFPKNFRIVFSEWIQQ